MTFNEYENYLKRMYPVNKVNKGFAYWRRHLLERCFGTFRYKGLPESLPEIELEKRVLFGFAPVFRSKEFGLVTCWSTVTGVNQYGRPLTCTYSQPVLGSGTLTIGKDVAIIYNDSSDETSEYQTPRGLTELIDRFARLLADVDASMDIMLVNARKTAWPVAKDSAVANSIKSAYEKQRNGDFEVVTDVGIYDFFKVFPETTSARSMSMNDLIAAKEHYLRDFMAQIGIKSAERKAERMLTDEIAADDALLDANLADMLEARKRGVERVNQLFGTNITVELGRQPNEQKKPTPEEDPKEEPAEEEGGEEDGDVSDRDN